MSTRREQDGGDGLGVQLRLAGCRARHVIRDRGFRRFLLDLCLRGTVKRIRNRIRFRRPHRCPQPVVFVAGFARGGSTWLADMLADALGFDVFTPRRWPLGLTAGHEHDIYGGLFGEYKGMLAVVKGHTWGTQENVARLRLEYEGKYVISVRDPRDALISAYWYLRSHPAHVEHDSVARLTLKEFIDAKLDSGEFDGQFVAWLESWLHNRDAERSILVRYEDLLADPEREVTRVLRFLEADVEPARVAAVVVRQGFERRTGRKQGHEDTASFVRKGVAGEWRDVFTDEQRRRVSVLGRGVLSEIGYDATADGREDLT